MKKILLLFITGWSLINLNAQHNVTLKVIDNQDGALTNKVDDNNETNVFCWAGNGAGTLYAGDWWYPMYNGEAGRTGGLLVKDNGVWTWQCTFENVAPGDYWWKPHMKTLGWSPLRNLYNYDENGDLHFSVAQDGTVSGQTSLELPLTATNTQQELTEELNVYTRDKVIVVANVKQGEDIFLFNLSGKLVSKALGNSTEVEITVAQSGIYLVKSGQSSIKVFVK